MILRRVIMHFRKQEWTAIALDFLIVVVGVFVGLQVNNWNQDLQDKRIAENYLGRLEEDLRSELQYYGHVTDYYKATRAHAIGALDAYARPADELDVEFLIDLYQASQQWSVSTRRGTYDELLATGRIGLISDELMRSMLNNYYESSAARKITFERSSFVGYRKVIRMLMDDAIQRKIREKCDDIYMIAENNSYYLSLPESCEIELPSDLIKSEIERLLINDQVRQELRFQLSSLDSLLGSIGNGAATADAALAELEKAAP